MNSGLHYATVCNTALCSDFLTIHPWADSCNRGRFSVTSFPPPLGSREGGQADSVPCLLPYSNKSIHTQPRGEHPLLRGIFIKRMPNVGGSKTEPYRVRTVEDACPYIHGKMRCTKGHLTTKHRTRGASYRQGRELQLSIQNNQVFCTQ